MDSFKKLYRPREGRKFAGVCAGLAEYFNVDPTLVRIIFVLASLTGGPGFLVYIVLMMIMPEEELGFQARDAEGEKPKRDTV